jgi:hypothetical protein
MEKQTSSTPTKRSISARDNASLGGEERARRFADQPELLKEWSSWGGKAVLEKYGREYFVKIRKLRQDYPSKCEDFPEADRIRRSIAAKVNGRKGGLVRAELYGDEHRREWGRLGGLATKSLYGSDFFRLIRKRRFTYRKGYITKKTKLRLRAEALKNAKAEENWAIRELWRAVAREWKR